MNEPMYLISESELLVVSEECGFTDSHKRAMKAIRARGPVHSGAQQQAPVGSRCVIITSCRSCPWIEMTTMPGIVDNPDGTPKQLIWCLGEDDSRIDLVESELDTIHKDCPLPSFCHIKDAALIAQEREKWERERAKALTFDEVAEEVRLTDSGFVKCNCIDDECEDCGKKSAVLYTHLDPETGEADAYRCPECAIKWNNEKRLESLHCGMMADFENNAAIAAQAQEDVLTRIITAMKTGEQCPNTYCINEQMNCIDCWVQWIESIRSEARK